MKHCAAILHEEAIMEDVHRVFTQFREEFPDVFAHYEKLGSEIHEKSGPLPEKTRWLIKIALSAADRHGRALKTHLMKAKEAGVKDEEIKHALLLMIATNGFPAFMEAYAVVKGIE
jgi:AhpD family alkylhydroperoxidase